MKLILLVFSSCVIWLSPVVGRTSAERNEALIFNRFSERPIHLPNNISKQAECGAWAVACPAETAAEHYFVQRHSLAKTALIVREIHTKGGKALEVKKNVCQEYPKMSIIFSMKNYTFQFGYEIFYQVKDVQFFHHDNYRNYKTPKGVIEFTKSVFKKTIFETTEFYQRVKTWLENSLGVDIEELWLNEDKQMRFLWLYLFKINFNLSKKILKMAWYEIYDNNRWTTGEKCDSYSLGSEIYEGVDVDTLYATQAKIFQDVKLPENACESTDTCLTKWLLVPIDQFRFNFSSTPVCSNIATIPIWRKKVLNVLKKVDTYLYSLFRALGEPLHVVSGILGEIKVSKNGGWRKSSIFYLDPDHEKIPLPKIIFKIVEYRLKNCQLEESMCWYSVVIVIHNDPYFTSRDRICDDVTTFLGWKEITKDYNGDPSDIIYVCENDRTVQKKLFIRPKQHVAGGMYLHEFKFSEDGKTIHTKNAKHFADENFKYFRKNGEIPDFGSNEIIDRVHPRTNTEDPEVKDQIY